MPEFVKGESDMAQEQCDATSHPGTKRKDTDSKKLIIFEGIDIIRYDLNKY